MGTLTPGHPPLNPELLQCLVQGCAPYRTPHQRANPLLPRDPSCPPAVPSFSYLIGKDTWLETWPSEVACQDPELQSLCQDFVEFSEAMTIFGCPS